MKADAIGKKIIEDASVAAAGILKDAHMRAEEQRKDSEARMNERRKALDSQTKQDQDVLRSRMLRMAELEAKKDMLGAKREVIDQVFDTALAGMRNMPKDQQAAYNKRLLLQAAQGGEQILCDQADRGMFDGAFLSDVNQQLQALGKTPVSMGSEARPIEGGFILSAGGMEINCSYAAVLREAKQGMEADVANMLFGEA
ncbi:hypothetical protein LJC33_00845 [Eubacteriales bacterium OttesenSCG-928-N13]|nr:hypothetical protein [Eubacteriales bacterium OttesenSCG-928-N13]